jgi:hypothetical protein
MKFEINEQNGFEEERLYATGNDSNVQTNEKARLLTTEQSEHLGAATTTSLFKIN